MEGLILITENELKKADKKALSTLYLYYLEKGKPTCFDLPLFVDDNGKGVMSVEAFKRVFNAFNVKTCNLNSCHFTADIASGDDGNDSHYNVVRVTLQKSKIDYDAEGYVIPKTSDVKRESSKVTAEKAKAKKAKAEAEKVKAEAEADADWNKKASMAIADHLIGKYKLTADRLTLETEIQNILNKIKA